MAYEEHAGGDPGGSMRRADLARRVCTVLGEGCPGSRAVLRGSLAAGTADAYSDIDVEWTVADAAFGRCLGRAAALVARAHPVAQVRADPDFLHSDRRGLLFVRFAGLPLFWRLDLSVRARSVAADDGCDTANPAARARDGEWSRPASALANAVAAVKAAARGHDAAARGLLDRGFARIGVPERSGGDRRADVGRLARAAAALEPDLAPLAREVTELAGRHLPR